MKKDNRGFNITRVNRLETYGSLESLFVMFGQQTGFLITESNSPGLVMKVTQFADGRFNELICCNDRMEYYRILKKTKVIKYHIRFNATKLLLIEVNEKDEISSEVDNKQYLRGFADEKYLPFDHRGRKLFVQKAAGEVSMIHVPCCRRLNQDKRVVVDSKLIQEAMTSECYNDHTVLRFNHVTQTFDIKIPYQLRYQVREIFGEGIEFDYKTLHWHTDIENRVRAINLVQELERRYELEMFD